jgi:hypothetical protein
MRWEFRIRTGLSAEVSTATATATSKIGAPPIRVPTGAAAAITKLNSPICVRLIPDCTATRTGCPDRNAPADTPTDFATSTTSVSARITGQTANALSGSSSMPAATKKMPPKMCRSGSTSGSTRLPTPASASSAPATKAPRATENPSTRANSASVKQSPTLANSSVSRRRSATT